jgi:ubiquinol-cytochrome c reductase cytochrome c subunit
MKHLSTLLVIGAGALLIGALATPRVDAQGTGDAARGKAAFVKNGCYECHGTVGQGNLAAGPPIAPHPIPYANFIAYIRAPRADMPPYSAKILPENVAQDIYAYIASIPAGPHADSIALLKDAGGVAPLPPNLAHGRDLFLDNCAKCHAYAQIGPPLGNVRARLSLDKTVDVIKNPGPRMPKLFPGTLSDRDVADVAAYVQTL